MAAIFGEIKFFEKWDNYSAEIPCGSKISSKSLYLSIFMFCNFCEKFENLKWPPFFARQNFFADRYGYSAELPCGSKISSKSLYLVRFSRYKHFYVLRKIRKFKMAAIFGEIKFFEKWDNYSAEIPCGSKISSKSLYLSIFMFCNFCEKFENLKWPPFFARQNFFADRYGYSAELPCGPKISSKSLYLVRFSRYKHFYVLRKIRKFKMAAIFGEIKFFEKWDNYSAEIPCGSKISSKSLYLARFSRYKHSCVLQFLRKIRKFKMAAIFGEKNFF